MTTLRLFLPMLIGLAVNAALTPLIVHLAHRHRWYDERNHRKIHIEDTPRIGGVGIFVGYLVAAAVAVIVVVTAPAGLPLALGTDPRAVDVILYLLPIILGMSIIHLLGLVDDFRNLRAVVKLFVQIAAAAIVTVGPFRIERLTIPFIWYHLELGLFSYPVTVLWIVAVSNALNFIDGVDGLAGGTAAFAALFFAVIGLLTGQTLVALLAMGLFGTIAGFLIFNAPPAKIFMGDSGSYVLGFMLALFPLMLGHGTNMSLDLIPAITILAVPLMDVTTSVFRRMRRGKHPFSADREHLHHKLMDLGFGTWRILAVAYGASAILGAVGVIWYLLPVNVDTIVTLASWAVAIALLVRLTHARHQQNGSGRP
jgi:UDP-GlcNAc:undecaprenyl-phosphate/decaprenyl-phosphate GlcNAc-1-phosphate transferase